ncbi:MAG: hypothetical protein OXH11_08660, partial [Candidatus Aminicenantes bacterium]|nr:hypothetical protein [Candidatus Aminicenantes bacterium]
NRVEGALSDLGATVISIRRSFEASSTPIKEFFLTDSHFNQNGHAHAAERILDQMREAGWTQSRSQNQEIDSIRADLEQSRRELFGCEPCRSD